MGSITAARLERLRYFQSWAELGRSGLQAFAFWGAAGCCKADQNALCQTSPHLLTFFWFCGRFWAQSVKLKDGKLFAELEGKWVTIPWKVSWSQGNRVEDCVCILRWVAFILGWQQADTEEELSADEESGWLQLTTQRLKGFAELGLSSSSFQIAWLLFRFSSAVYSVRISWLFFFSPEGACYHC